MPKACKGGPCMQLRSRAFTVVCACGLSAAVHAEWDVAQPPGPQAMAVVDTDEGSWMNLDVSPDGRWIVFDLLGDIFMMDIGGGAARALTQGLAFDSQPRFSPDGARIAFVSDRSGIDNIWIMDRDGGNARAVTAETFRKPSAPA